MYFPQATDTSMRDAGVQYTTPRAAPPPLATIHTNSARFSGTPTGTPKRGRDVEEFSPHAFSPLTPKKQRSFVRGDGWDGAATATPDWMCSGLNSGNGAFSGGLAPTRSKSDVLLESQRGLLEHPWTTAISDATALAGKSTDTSFRRTLHHSKLATPRDAPPAISPRAQPAGRDPPITVQGVTHVYTPQTVPERSIGMQKPVLQGPKDLGFNSNRTVDLNAVHLVQKGGPSRRHTVTSYHDTGAKSAVIMQQVTTGIAPKARMNPLGEPGASGQPQQRTRAQAWGSSTELSTGNGHVEGEYGGGGWPPRSNQKQQQPL